MQNVLPLPWKREHIPFASGDPVADAGVAEPETELADSPHTMSVRGIELDSLASLALRCAIVVGAAGALTVIVVLALLLPPWPSFTVRLAEYVPAAYW